MKNQLRYKYYRLMELILILVINISFININFHISNDIIVAIWCYLWQPSKQHLILIVFSWFGILLTLSPLIFKKEKYFKYKFCSYLGICIQCIIILCLWSKVARFQRYDLINAQYIFCASILLYLINGFLVKRLIGK